MKGTLNCARAQVNPLSLPLILCCARIGHHGQMSLPSSLDRTQNPVTAVSYAAIPIRGERQTTMIDEIMDIWSNIFTSSGGRRRLISGGREQTKENGLGDKIDSEKNNIFQHWKNIS